MLCVGLGSVSTTLIAGVELIRRGMGEPIGSLAELGTVRLGRRTERRTPRIRDFVPIADLDDLVFGAWDVFPDDAYVAAVRAGVLDADRHLEPVADALRAVRPMTAVFDPTFVRRLDGTHVKPITSKREQVEALRQDIRDFRVDHGCDRLVMIWCGSTEVYIDIGPAHADRAASRALSSFLIFAAPQLRDSRHARQRSFCVVSTALNAMNRNGLMTWRMRTTPSLIRCGAYPSAPHPFLNQQFDRWIRL